MPEPHPLLAAGARANLCLHDVSDAGDSIYTLGLSTVLELASRLSADGIAERVSFYFDDGYRSAVDVVPLLRERYPEIEIALALVVGSLGRPGYLSWDEARELARTGARITGHGIDHLHLAEESAESVRFQLSQTKSALVEFGIDEFVLPYGSYNQTVLDVASELALYQHVTTIDYAWDRGQFLRPRLMVTTELTPAQVCARFRT